MTKGESSSFKRFVPPIFWELASSIVNQARRRRQATLNPNEQSLDDYWDPNVASILETWGADSAWMEIQLLLANCRGRVLDIACGNGIVIELLKSNQNLEVYGFDISDLLIKRAVERGVPPERLRVYDATRTGYDDAAFDFSYSIGSLEHFTEEGIVAFLREARRVTKDISYHQIPTAADAKNHGWIRTFQSYHNNSVDWWLKHFRQVYTDVMVLDSTWKDSLSRGKWFICKS